MRADSAPPCSQATSRSPALLGLNKEQPDQKSKTLYDRRLIRGHFSWDGLNFTFANKHEKNNESWISKYCQALLFLAAMGYCKLSSVPSFP